MAFTALAEARLMLETGWTWDQLCNTPEDVVWLVLQVMGLDGEKAKEQQRNGGRTPSLDTIRRTPL